MKIKTVGDLKKYLEGIPDKTEIKYFNGMVDDWMDLDIYPETLSKYKPKFELMIVNLQRLQDGKPELTKLGRQSEWEIDDNSGYDDEDELNKNRIFKNILMFGGKRRNKSSFDRMGNIDY